MQAKGPLWIREDLQLSAASLHRFPGCFVLARNAIVLTIACYTESTSPIFTLLCTGDN